MNYLTNFMNASSPFDSLLFNCHNHMCACVCSECIHVCEWYKCQMWEVNLIQNCLNLGQPLPIVM
jgi:hypothetical protein